MLHINHCHRDNPVTERWFLKNDTAILFSVCEFCGKKLAIEIDLKSKRRIGKLFVGDKRIDFLKKKNKKHVNYKDFDTPSIRNWGFVFGVNVEIHDCKGRIRAIKQKAKDFFGCENLIKEIDTV